MRQEAPHLPEHSLQQLSAVSLQKLRDEGVIIDATGDLDVFERAMMAIGAIENHPMMSTKTNDFASGDALGLMVRDASDKYVGGIAARCIDLGAECLSDHMEKHYRRLYGGGTTDAISSRISATKQMRGRIVYQGQWYFHETARGTIHTPALFHYFHCLCFAKWRPDWVYGFFPVRLAERAFIHGYPHIHLQAHSWLVQTERRGPKECLVYSSFDEFAERAKALTDFPEFYPNKPSATESNS